MKLIRARCLFPRRCVRSRSRGNIVTSQLRLVPALLPLEGRFVGLASAPPSVYSPAYGSCQRDGYDEADSYGGRNTRPAGSRAVVAAGDEVGGLKSHFG